MIRLRLGLVMNAVSDGRARGQAVSAGVYLARLEDAGQEITQKPQLVK